LRPLVNDLIATVWVRADPNVTPLDVPVWEINGTFGKGATAITWALIGIIAFLAIDRRGVILADENRATLLIAISACTIAVPIIGPDPAVVVVVAIAIVAIVIIARGPGACALAHARAHGGAEDGTK